MPMQFDPNITTYDDRFKSEAAAIILMHDRDLEAWAEANKKTARRDFWRFWAFKLPAILSSVTTAASAALGWPEQITSILAAAAAISVAVDGFWPGGLLHNVHLRAVHDIELLRARTRTSLHKIELQHSDESSEDRTNAFVKLLEDIDKERSRIGKYIASAESSLGVGREITPIEKESPSGARE